MRYNMRHVLETIDALNLWINYTTLADIRSALWAGVITVDEGIELAIVGRLNK